MSWLCLVCECIHALCLSIFSRPSFPSFFGWSCWFVAQLNKIAKQTDRWMKIISTRPCLRLRTNVGPRIAFWGPDLGHILVPVSGSIFGHRFGPLQLQTKSKAPKPRPKMEPKTGTKIWPKSGPQNAIRGPKFVRRCKQGLHDLHSAVCWAIGFNCATNQQLQPKKEGKLGRAKLLKQTAWIDSQTKHSQNMFYLQKIHSQVSRMGKSTSCLLLWGYAHASPQNCLFWGPGFGTSFCSILRPLLATLLLSWLADFAATLQGCCACVGQVVVCRASSLHLSMLRQKSEKCP